MPRATSLDARSYYLLLFTGTVRFRLVALSMPDVNTLTEILVKMRLDAQQGDWAKTEETRRLSFHGEEREETALVGDVGSLFDASECFLKGAETTLGAIRKDRKRNCRHHKHK